MRLSEVQYNYTGDDDGDDDADGKVQVPVVPNRVPLHLAGIYDVAYCVGVVELRNLKNPKIHQFLTNENVP